MQPEAGGGQGAGGLGQGLAQERIEGLLSLPLRREPRRGKGTAVVQDAGIVGKASERQVCGVSELILQLFSGLNHRFSLFCFTVVYRDHSRAASGEM